MLFVSRQKIMLLDVYKGQGLGIAGLLIIVFSTVTTTYLDAYSAGVSSETIFSKINGKYMAIAVTIVGTIAAIIYPMDDICLLYTSRCV